jgi:Cu+-exporting ATPase
MTTQTDPVCEMQVDEQHSAGTSEYNNTTYYFCSQACKQKFDATPERYTGQGTSTD